MSLDILIERLPSESDLRAAVGVLVGLPVSDVEVVVSAEDFGGRVPVAAIVSQIRGEFEALVEVETDADNKEQLRPDLFARKLQQRCLIPDDAIDPYTMILVEPDGSQRPASLDATALNERMEYVLDDRGRLGR